MSAQQCTHCRDERHPYADPIDNYVCELCRVREELNRVKKENATFRALLNKALTENGISVADIYAACNPEQEVS